MKIIVVIFLTVMIFCACRKESLQDLTINYGGSSSKDNYDSTVKIMDSVYVANCVLYHRIMWMKYVHGRSAYCLDTIIARGTPCVSNWIAPGIFLHLSDTCYSKYCLEYCEHTWHNQTGVPWGDRDTIYIYGNNPCLPPSPNPPAY